MKQQMPALGVWLGKAQSWLLCIAVLGTLAAPALIHMAGKSTDPSLLDNRPRAQLPELPTSISNIERFRDGVTKFIDSNFGLRVELVKLNFLIHSWIGESSVPGLMKGKDGWFFLKSDFAILDQFRGINRFTDAELDTWIDTMEVYRDWLALKGIAFVILIAPNQQTIYPELMPDYANRVWPETRLDQIVRRLRERQSRLIFIDPRGDMSAERSNAVLYRKYENHWNPLGAFVAYSAMMRQVAKLFPRIEVLRKPDFDIGAHELGWQMPPRSEVEPTLTLRRKSKVTTSDVLEVRNGQPVTRTWSSDENAPSVLIYGDSFGLQSLNALIAESFRSTIFLAANHSPFPDDLIARHRPDLVLYEMVERYIPRPFSDIESLRAELLASKAPRLQQMLDKSEGISGNIDGVSFENETIRLPGWAVDIRANTPAREIYAYEGEQLIGATKPTVARPDVTVGMSDHNAGFNLQIKPGAQGTAAGQIRIFSWNADERVAEIHISPELLRKIETLRR